MDATSEFALYEGAGHFNFNAESGVLKIARDVTKACGRAARKGKSRTIQAFKTIMSADDDNNNTEERLSDEKPSPRLSWQESRKGSENEFVPERAVDNNRSAQSMDTKPPLQKRRSSERRSGEDDTVASSRVDLGEPLVHQKSSFQSQLSRAESNSTPIPYNEIMAVPATPQQQQQHHQQREEPQKEKQLKHKSQPPLTQFVAPTAPNTSPPVALTVQQAPPVTIYHYPYCPDMYPILPGAQNNHQLQQRPCNNTLDEQTTEMKCSCKVIPKTGFLTRKESSCQPRPEQRNCAKGETSVDCPVCFRDSDRVDKCKSTRTRMHRPNCSIDTKNVSKCVEKAIYRKLLRMMIGRESSIDCVNTLRDKCFESSRELMRKSLNQMGSDDRSRCRERCLARPKGKRYRSKNIGIQCRQEASQVCCIQESLATVQTSDDDNGNVKQLKTEQCKTIQFSIKNQKTKSKPICLNVDLSQLIRVAGANLKAKDSCHVRSKCCQVSERKTKGTQCNGSFGKAMRPCYFNAHTNPYNDITHSDETCTTCKCKVPFPCDCAKHKYSYSCNDRTFDVACNADPYDDSVTDKQNGVHDPICQQQHTGCDEETNHAINLSPYSTRDIEAFRDRRRGLEETICQAHDMECSDKSNDMMCLCQGYKPSNEACIRRKDWQIHVKVTGNAKKKCCSVDKNESQPQERECMEDRVVTNIPPNSRMPCRSAGAVKNNPHDDRKDAMSSNGQLKSSAKSETPCPEIYSWYHHEDRLNNARDKIRSLNNDIEITKTKMRRELIQSRQRNIERKDKLIQVKSMQYRPTHREQMHKRVCDDCNGNQTRLLKNKTATTFVKGRNRSLSKTRGLVNAESSYMKTNKALDVNESRVRSLVIEQNNEVGHSTSGNEDSSKETGTSLATLLQFSLSSAGDDMGETLSRRDNETSSEKSDEEQSLTSKSNRSAHLNNKQTASNTSNSLDSCKLLLNLDNDIKMACNDEEENSISTGNNIVSQSDDSATSIVLTDNEACHVSGTNQIANNTKLEANSKDKVGNTEFNAVEIDNRTLSDSKSCDFSVSSISRNKQMNQPSESNKDDTLDDVSFQDEPKECQCSSAVERDYIVNEENSDINNTDERNIYWTDSTIVTNELEEKEDVTYSSKIYEDVQEKTPRSCPKESNSDKVDCQGDTKQCHQSHTPETSCRRVQDPCFRSHNRYPCIECSTTKLTLKTRERLPVSKPTIGKGARSRHVQDIPFIEELSSKHNSSIEHHYVITPTSYSDKVDCQGDTKQCDQSHTPETHSRRVPDPCFRSHNIYPCIECSATKQTLKTRERLPVEQLSIGKGARSRRVQDIPSIEELSSQHNSCNEHHRTVITPTSYSNIVNSQGDTKQCHQSHTPESSCQRLQEPCFRSHNRYPCIECSATKQILQIRDCLPVHKPSIGKGARSRRVQDTPSREELSSKHNSSTSHNYVITPTSYSDKVDCQDDTKQRHQSHTPETSYRRVQEPCFSSHNRYPCIECSATKQILKTRESLPVSKPSIGKGARSQHVQDTPSRKELSFKHNSCNEPHCNVITPTSYSDKVDCQDDTKQCHQSHNRYPCIECSATKQTLKTRERLAVQKSTIGKGARSRRVQDIPSIEELSSKHNSSTARHYVITPTSYSDNVDCQGDTKQCDQCHTPETHSRRVQDPCFRSHNRYPCIECSTTKQTLKTRERLPVSKPSIGKGARSRHVQDTPSREELSSKHNSCNEHHYVINPKNNSGKVDCQDDTKQCHQSHNIYPCIECSATKQTLKTRERFPVEQLSIGKGARSRRVQDIPSREELSSQHNSCNEHHRTVITPTSYSNIVNSQGDTKQCHQRDTPETSCQRLQEPCFRSHNRYPCIECCSATKQTLKTWERLPVQKPSIGKGARCRRVQDIPSIEELSSKHNSSTSHNYVITPTSYSDQVDCQGDTKQCHRSHTPETSYRRVQDPCFRSHNIYPCIECSATKQTLKTRKCLPVSKPSIEKEDPCRHVQDIPSIEELSSKHNSSTSHNYVITPTSYSDKVDCQGDTKQCHQSHTPETHSRRVQDPCFRSHNRYPCIECSTTKQTLKTRERLPVSKPTIGKGARSRHVQDIPSREELSSKHNSSTAHHYIITPTSYSDKVDCQGDTKQCHQSHTPETTTTSCRSIQDPCFRSHNRYPCIECPRHSNNKHHTMSTPFSAASFPLLTVGDSQRMGENNIFPFIDLDANRVNKEHNAVNVAHIIQQAFESQVEEPDYSGKEKCEIHYNHFIQDENETKRLQMDSSFCNYVLPLSTTNTSCDQKNDIKMSVENKNAEVPLIDAGKAFEPQTDRGDTIKPQKICECETPAPVCTRPFMIIGGSQRVGRNNKIKIVGMTSHFFCDMDATILGKKHEKINVTQEIQQALESQLNGDDSGKRKLIIQNDLNQDQNQTIQSPDQNQIKSIQTDSSLSLSDLSSENHCLCVQDPDSIESESSSKHNISPPRECLTDQTLSSITLSCDINLHDISDVDEKCHAPKRKENGNRCCKNDTQVRANPHCGKMNSSSKHKKSSCRHPCRDCADKTPSNPCCESKHKKSSCRHPCRDCADKTPSNPCCESKHKKSSCRHPCRDSADKTPSNPCCESKHKKSSCRHPCRDCADKTPSNPCCESKHKKSSCRHPCRDSADKTPSEPCCESKHKKSSCRHPCRDSADKTPSNPCCESKHKKSSCRHPCRDCADKTPSNPCCESTHKKSSCRHPCRDCADKTLFNPCCESKASPQHKIVPSALGCPRPRERRSCIRDSPQRSNENNPGTNQSKSRVKPDRNVCSPCPHTNEKDKRCGVKKETKNRCNNKVNCKETDVCNESSQCDGIPGNSKHRRDEKKDVYSSEKRRKCNEKQNETHCLKREESKTAKVDDSNICCSAEEREREREKRCGIKKETKNKNDKKMNCEEVDVCNEPCRQYDVIPENSKNNCGEKNIVCNSEKRGKCDVKQNETPCLKQEENKKATLENSNICRSAKQRERERGSSKCTCKTKGIKSPDSDDSDGNPDFKKTCAFNRVPCSSSFNDFEDYGYIEKMTGCAKKCHTCSNSRKSRDSFAEMEECMANRVKVISCEGCHGRTCEHCGRCCDRCPPLCTCVCRKEQMKICRALLAKQKQSINISKSKREPFGYYCKGCSSIPDQIPLCNGGDVVRGVFATSRHHPKPQVCNSYSSLDCYCESAVDDEVNNDTHDDPYMTCWQSPSKLNQRKSTKELFKSIHHRCCNLRNMFTSTNLQVKSKAVRNKAKSLLHIHIHKKSKKTPKSFQIELQK